MLHFNHWLHLEPQSLQNTNRKPYLASCESIGKIVCSKSCFDKFQLWHSTTRLSRACGSCSCICRQLPTCVSTEPKCGENYRKSWHNIFFLKLQSACWQFQTITVPECCLIKLLPYILLQKYINILALEMASAGNRRRSQRTFAPCCQLSCIFSLVVGYLPPALAGNVLQSVVSVRPFISCEEGM